MAFTRDFSFSVQISVLAIVSLIEFASAGFASEGPSSSELERFVEEYYGENFDAQINEYRNYPSGGGRGRVSATGELIARFDLYKNIGQDWLKSKFASWPEDDIRSVMANAQGDAYSKWISEGVKVYIELDLEYTLRVTGTEFIGRPKPTRFRTLERLSNIKFPSYATNTPEAEEKLRALGRELQALSDARGAAQQRLEEKVNSVTGYFGGSILQARLGDHSLIYEVDCTNKHPEVPALSDKDRRKSYWRDVEYAYVLVCEVIAHQRFVANNNLFKQGEKGLFKYTFRFWDNENLIIDVSTKKDDPYFSSVISTGGRAKWDGGTIHTKIRGGGLSTSKVTLNKKNSGSASRARKVNGKGRLVQPNGDVYEGSWVAGEIEGKGRVTYPDGSVYEGQFRDGQPDGQGKITYPDGSTYEGEWRAGVIEGEGVATYANGLVYEGQFKDAKNHGTGVMTYPDGYRYEGEWQNGQRHGQGTATYPDGTVYEGQFEDGQRHGQGRIVIPDDPETETDESFVYEGEWKRGEISGKGVATYSNGDVYEGMFENGKRQGSGTMRYAYGQEASGQWQNGALLEE